MSRTFALVLEDFTVEQIVVISEEDVLGLPFPESEPYGQAFLHALYGNNDVWLETSETGAFRGQYATIGGKYVPLTDEFVPPVNPEEAS
jgi:hypothetical protein